MAFLGVNIDHIATLRQARQGNDPDPVAAAVLCEQAGADAIVAHLREDRRHINDNDVIALKKKVRTKFNLEMSVNRDIVAIACEIKPDQATLVPEKRRELTTEGGLDVASNPDAVSRVIENLRNNLVEVSLFIDPDKQQINASERIGASMIEIHTGSYAQATNKGRRLRYLRQIREAASYAANRGLRVCAGHGLDYHTVKQIARIREIEELNIGYSIICRALRVGLERAVREMKELCG